MAAEVAVVRLAFDIAVSALLAVGFTALAWRVRRRTGARGLVRLWLGATVLIAVLATTSAVHNYAKVLQPTLKTVLEFAALYVVVLLCGLGAITWRVNTRLGREPGAPLTFGSLLRGVAVFFAALFVLGLPLLVWDVSRWL